MGGHLFQLTSGKHPEEDNHVGIIIESNEIIHASGKVRVDLLDEKGIFNREQKSYTHYLFKIKRVLN